MTPLVFGTDRNLLSRVRAHGKMSGAQSMLMSLLLLLLRGSNWRRITGLNFLIKEELEGIHHGQ